MSPVVDRGAARWSRTFGLIALGGAVAAAVRHGVPSTWPAIAVAVAAVGSFGLLFVFAGGGPGSWFQYCGN